MTQDSDNQVLLKVSGMSCGGCVTNVKTALEKVPGVKSAEVHLISASAVVTMGEKKPSVEDLVAAVRKAGYDARL